jgi:LmbE family N-acetylglucosaminyl deacetylase
MKPDVWIPDGLAEPAAFARTTHMGVVAHPDDLEIEGYPGIVECFGREDRWFCGVVVTDGAGSARGGPYAKVSNEEMVAIRRKEQHKAAMVGEYGAMVMLGVTSAAIKDPARPGVVEALADLLRRARPEVVYTHNLADKHDTHVAVSLSVIDACRSLPADQRPRRLLGGEGWRDLDWLTGDDKVALDVSARESLSAALIGVFDSQITGGKRYDLAVAGLRRAHATLDESHHLDATTGLAFYMDLTPLLADTARDPVAFAEERVQRFAADVKGRIQRLRGTETRAK